MLISLCYCNALKATRRVTALTSTVGVLSKRMEEVVPVAKEAMVSAAVYKHKDKVLNIIDFIHGLPLEWASGPRHKTYFA